MFRWFRNFGTLFRKPRGVLNSNSNVNSQRNTDKIGCDPGSEEPRSDCGKGGGGGGGGRSGGHGGHSGGHGHGHGSSTSSMSGTKSTNTTSTRSTSRGSSTASRTNSTSVSRSRNYSSTASTRPTSSGTSAASSTRSGRSSKSSKCNSSSTASRPTSSYSQGSKSVSKSRRVTRKKRRPNTSAASRRQLRSVSTKSQTKSAKSKKAQRVPSQQSRGRSVARRDNVNADASRRRSRSVSKSRGRRANDKSTSESIDRSTKSQRKSKRDASTKSDKLDSVLSPTNRASLLNRSSSAHHERTFQDRQQKSNGVWNETFPKGTLIIYTDGSYLKHERVSGIGIFVGPGHSLNRSHRIRGPIQNNNYAEFVAVRTALENALKHEEYRDKKVVVRTDCLNVIEALKGTRGTEFPKLKSEVEALSTKFPKGVEFQHVYAHEGDPGNEMADLLAGLATSKQQDYGGFRRHGRSASRGNRERNRQRSKSNDPAFIRSRSHSIQGRI